MVPPVVKSFTVGSGPAERGMDMGTSSVSAAWAKGSSGSAKMGSSRGRNWNEFIWEAEYGNQ
jgi:hypothetical protein